MQVKEPQKTWSCEFKKLRAQKAESLKGWEFKRLRALNAESSKSWELKKLRAQKAKSLKGREHEKLAELSIIFILSQILISKYI